MLKSIFCHQNSYITRFKFDKWLLLLLAAAFLLRIWGIWNADSTDEYNEVFEALRVCSGSLNFERWFKRFYLYVLAIEYGIYFVIGWIFNIFQSSTDFAVKIVRDPYPLFILGRITSTLFGTGSVLLTYSIGKLLYNRKVGLIAALFLCLNVVNIELSHYARVDASLCFVVLAGFYFIAKILTDKDLVFSTYILAGIFSGIAFQNKMQAIILLFPFSYTYFGKYQWKQFWRPVFSKALIIFCLSYLAGMVIGNPAIVFAPVSFIKGVLSWGHMAYTVPINETISQHIGYIVYLRYFFKELGILLSILAVFSLFHAIFSFNRRDVLLLSFILPLYGLMGASRYMVSYSYMIPLMPFVYLLMAKSLTGGLNKLSGNQKKSTVLTSFILLVLLISPMLNVLKFEKSLSGKNTRVLAREWIEQNIPYGSKILMDSGKTINSFAPLISANKESIQRTLERKTMEVKTGSQNDPTQMVDANSLKYFEMLIKTIPPESYNITSTQFGLAVKPIDYYISNKFQYLIISEGMKKSRIAEAFAKRHPEAAGFYRSLDTNDNLKLIKTINPAPRNRGQSFFIYKVSGE
jgi:hypothetical protein